MKHWPTKPLGEVLEISRERIEPTEHPDTSFNYVGLESIQGHTGNLLPYQTTLGAKIKSTKNVFHHGEILYGKLRPYLNKIHLASDDGICSTDIYVFRPRKNQIHPSFAVNYLRSPSVLTVVSNAMAGANLPRIGQDALLDIPVPVPPMVEQERIVKLLDEADKLRKLRAYADSRTDQLIPAIFQKLFGDPATNEKLWPKFRLHQVSANVTDGTHDTPERVAFGVPFITSKNIRPYEFDLTTLDYVSRETHLEIVKRCNPRFGDVLYTNIGVNIGNAVANRLNFEFSLKNVALIQPDFNRLDSSFLESLLNNASFKQSIIHGSSQGGAQKFVGLDRLRNILIVVPPLPLQREFAQRITEIRELEAYQATNRTRLEALFQSMSYRAFNGEL